MAARAGREGARRGRGVAFAQLHRGRRGAARPDRPRRRPVAARRRARPAPLRRRGRHRPRDGRGGAVPEAARAPARAGRQGRARRGDEGRVAPAQACSRRRIRGPHREALPPLARRSRKLDPQPARARHHGDSARRGEGADRRRAGWGPPRGRGLMSATDVERELLDEPGGFLDACRPDDLVYFALNVGDGDTQLLLLPEGRNGRRTCVVVDCIQAKKLFALLETLTDEATGLLKPVEPLLELVVATHPHDDHISGMEALLRRFGEKHVREFWEPGYYHPSAAYLGMMRELEDLDVLHLQPASGTTRYLGQVKFTVLAPGVVLRSQFDSYGVDINNASIALKLDYPAARTIEKPKKRSLSKGHSMQTLILGADAQTRSWAQVLVDFPQLGPHNTEVTKALRRADGYEPLAADVFKVPHHGSKHGLNLELVEQVMPAVSIVSSVHDAGKYGFPHEVTQAALREALDPISSKPPGSDHKSDAELGILYTSSAEQRDGKPDPSKPVGTVALLLGGGSRREVWRFGDGEEDPIDLTAGRRMRAVGPAETAQQAAPSASR